MLMKKVAVTATLLVSAIAGSAATAHAAPAAETAVGFTAETVGDTAVITTDAGAMAVQDNTFTIKSSDGTVLAGTPLTFRVDDFEFPIAADVTGRKATLTPLLDMEHAVYRPVALPFEEHAQWKTPYEREKDAFNRMKDTILAGGVIGTVIGGIAGGALGCVLGGIAGATVAAATIVGLFGPFIPAAAVGCIGGILAVGALGTLAGQILVTAPVAIGAAIQYFTTINQPFVPAK